MVIEYFLYIFMEQTVLNPWIQGKMAASIGTRPLFDSDRHRKLDRFHADQYILDTSVSEPMCAPACVVILVSNMGWSISHQWKLQAPIACCTPLGLYSISDINYFNVNHPDRWQNSFSCTNVFICHTHYVDMLLSIGWKETFIFHEIW